MKKLITFCFIILFLTGCNTYKCIFPAEINDVAHGCRNDAQAKIQAHGHSLKTKSDCIVSLIPATANIKGMWCWRDARWPNAYVGGLCNGAYIKIGCNPKNRADIHAPTLTHEMGHHWLMTNFEDYTHNASYDNDFVNWGGSRRITGSSISNYMEYISIVYTNNDGSVTHVDTLELRK